MYDREINGAVYEFGVSGRLIMNSLVMYDRQTESYWSQVLGEAVEGPLAGTRLNHYSNTWQTTWADWVARFPNTIALDKGSTGSGDGYASYYRSNQIGIHGQTVDDDRLGAKEWVIGVEVNGEAAAYPFDTLASQPAVNDVIGGQQTVILFLPEGRTGMVFERTLGGELLTFSFVDGLLTDAETGSNWDAWTGTATAGPMEGQRLRRIASTRAFWFAWKDWYPETRVYGQG